MPVEFNKALVRRFVDGWWNYEKLLTLNDVLAPDYIYHDPLGDTHGARQFRDDTAEELEAFANVMVTIDDIVAEGDLVAVRYTTSYVHHGEFMHAYPSGKMTMLRGMSLHRVVDGRIAETWEAYDRRTMARDVGAEQRLSEADEAAIQDAVEKALKIGFDDRTALANHYWGENADVVAANGEKMRGRRGILDWLQRFPPVTKWELFDLNIEGAGEFACVRGAYQMTLSKRAKLPYDKGQYIEIWRKGSEGNWKVLHTVYTSELASRSKRNVQMAHA